jgi:tetratricopeptide (TPR) repeat protein
MIDILDKKMLESTFADDFASPYYPILAELYLQEGDLSRARKVCEIGLDHDSTNVDGKFVFAKVAMAEEKFTVAEKWLKKVVDENPAHFNALRMLIRLEFQLSRSQKTIQNYINRILQFLPEDPECMEWLKNIQALETVEPAPGPTETKPEKNSSIQSPKPDTEKKYKIEKAMATLTMAQVLESQRHYHEALAVIDVLESNGQDSNQIARKKEEILQHISASKK